MIINDKLLDKNTEIGKRLYGMHGVYVFKASRTCVLKQGITRHKKHKKPNLIEAEDIVYVGKSSVDSLFVRINNHLKGINSQMHLNINYELKNSVFYIAFTLKKEFKKYKNIVIDTLERQLHLTFPNIAIGNASN